MVSTCCWSYISSAVRGNFETTPGIECQNHCNLDYDDFDNNVFIELVECLVLLIEKIALLIFHFVFQVKYFRPLGS